MPLGIKVGRPRTTKAPEATDPPSMPDVGGEAATGRVRPGPVPSAARFIAMARQALRVSAAG